MTDSGSIFDTEIRLPFSEVSPEEAQALLDLTDVWHLDKYYEEKPDEPWPVRYLRIWTDQENHVKRIWFWNKSGSPCDHLNDVMKKVRHHLPHLLEIYIKDPTLATFPLWLQYYPHLTHLIIDDALFDSIPDNLFEMVPQLQMFQFTLPNLQSFPFPSTPYSSLSGFFLFAGPAFTALPDKFDLFPSLEHIHLQLSPAITTIPSTIMAARIKSLRFDNTSIRTMSEAFFMRFRHHQEFHINHLDLFFALQLEDVPSSDYIAFLYRETVMARLYLPLPRIQVAAWPTYREDWPLFLDLFRIDWLPDHTSNLDHLHETTNRYKRWVHFRRTGRPITPQFAHEDYRDFEHLFGHCTGFLESTTVILR